MLSERFIFDAFQTAWPIIDSLENTTCRIKKVLQIHILQILQWALSGWKYFVFIFLNNASRVTIPTCVIRPS